MEQRKAYRPREVASLTGISRTKVYELMRSGELPVAAITPRCLRIPADALDRFLETRVRAEGEW
jgi:excisionase family DNA binding protein